MSAQSFRYLSLELGQGAAGMAAASLLMMGMSCAVLGMGRNVDPAGSATLGIAFAVMSVVTCVAAVRKAALARAFERGELPRLREGFAVAVRTQVQPLWSNVLGLLFGYGFFGIFLLNAWIVNRKFPEAPHAGMAPIATVLMLASGWYLARSLMMESAAVRVGADIEDVREAVESAAAQGIVPEKVSVGAMVGGLFLLVAFLTLALDPKSARIAIKLLGERPLGVPWPVMLAGLVLVVGAPVVPLSHVLLSVMEHRLRTRGRASIRPVGFLWYLFSAYDGADARRARLAVAWGALYFAMVLAAWIAYTQSRNL